MENEKMKAKRKLESKQRQHRYKTMEQDAGGESDEDLMYERGNRNMMRGFDRYEEEGGDDFGNSI
jgi:hypothetical protein